MIQDQMEECPSDYTRRWSRMCSGWESSSGLERTWEDSRCLVPASDGGREQQAFLNSRQIGCARLQDKPAAHEGIFCGDG